MEGLTLEESEGDGSQEEDVRFTLEGSKASLLDYKWSQVWLVTMHAQGLYTGKYQSWEHKTRHK